MRGNNFVKILCKVDLIQDAFLTLKQKAHPTTQDFHDLVIKFKEVPGLGLSTYSKLLYYFSLSFNDNPCLILDQRLINVFASKTYSEFLQLSSISNYNAAKKYLDYIHLLNQVANKLGTKGENIEQFFFTFGNNLKKE